MSACDMIFRLGCAYTKLNKNVVFISTGTFLCMASIVVLNKKIKRLNDEIKELKNLKGE